MRLLLASIIFALVLPLWLHGVDAQGPCCTNSECDALDADSDTLVVNGASLSSKSF